MDKMTKAEARQLLGLPNDHKLAKMLGISRQAVSLWGGKSIPPERAEQVRRLAESAQADTPSTGD